ncbi:MAG: DUF5655 domain-containing protein [Acidobacteriota bacterium]|nr:DUF5655 domain-containing protein [Acidobacteriota bacterium]
MADEKDLWTCPVCGHRFVTENMWHSCGVYDLESHFEGKDPVVRDLFDRYRELVESCGKVVCYPQKTRIVFQKRIRFASCQTRKNSLRCGLILPAKYPNVKNLTKIESYGPRSHGHYFEMNVPEDFDAVFAELVLEAFQAGGK